jgi:organic radical activating enzyme
MFTLDYAEFYITNVCNLNCKNCNRFNNFYFKGHRLWETHKHDYAKWAELIEFDTIGILGGEPLLNPDFSNWFYGVCELWPNSKICVITNGTQIAKFKNLYSLLTGVNNHVIFEINCHNLDVKHVYEQQIEEMLGEECEKKYVSPDNWKYWRKSYNAVKDESWPECPTPDDFYKLPQWIQDELANDFDIWPEDIKLKQQQVILKNSQLTVKIHPAASFNNSTLIYEDSTQTLSLHKSDPLKAMEACYFKKCHHFIDGKLFKCGPVGILPDFVRQFDVQRDNEQEKLIQSYEPALPNWTNEKLNNFIYNLKNAIPIDQCSLCPEKMTNYDFTGTTDKIKLVRID